jgi:acyl-CoA thioester hydrolase
MKLEIPESKVLLHTISTPIRWGDMDAFGHVNNTIYFRYMESARIDMMQVAGFLSHPNSAEFVIANAFCNFIRQLEFPGEVLIKTDVGAIGKSSFDTYHELLRTEDQNTVYANGGATVVWLNSATQKSAPLPGELRKWLTKS